MTCPQCAQPLADCTCPRDAAGALCRPQDQPARVRREKRRGKFVTVVSGLDPSASDLPGLLAEWRRQFATGGTVTAGEIVLQGDHRDPLVAILRARGYPAKPAGG